MPALDQWENRLKPYFNRPLRIIGEIPLTREDVEDIADSFRGSIQRNGISEATEQIFKHYPHTFLAFMACFAAHNVEQSYWIALGERLGTHHNHLFNHHWHHFFLDQVKQRGLTYFESEKVANPFVTTIRFHGGIPEYSLPDFFERLLLPTVSRSGLSELPTPQAMAVVLRTAYFVDSPVINFLENSGKLGEEFFDACRKMARHHQQSHGDILPAAELKLPEYVVEAFRDYIERGEDQQASHLRRPVLFINPYTDLDRLWLKLPQQEFQPLNKNAELEWQVTWPGLKEPYRISCSLRRRGSQTILLESNVAIEEPVSQVNVALISSAAKPDVLRRWNLLLAPAIGHTPLMVFRSDGQQVTPERALPAEPLIMIYPKDASLKIEGTGRLLEEYGEMAGAWNGWQVHQWELSEAASIQIIRQGEPAEPAILVAGRQPRPELSGGTPAQFDDGEAPLYLGTPPKVKFPIRPGVDLEKELKRWSLEVKSLSETYPECNQVVTLADYAQEIEQDENFACFPLSRVLGGDPAESFTLRFFYHDEAVGEIDLRMCPQLEITGLPVSILGVELNNQPVTFNLSLQPGVKGNILVESGDAEMVETTEGWRITAGSDTADISLSLLLPVQGNKRARVPLQIPIPRLLWALAMDRDLKSMEWTNKPLEKSAAAILDCNSASLHVKAHGLKKYLHQARLELVELDQKKHVLQEGSFQTGLFSPDWWRIPLGQFFDTLRNDCQQGSFEFVIPANNGQQEIRIPLLNVQCQMMVKNVAIKKLERGGWKITWDEDHQLRNRRFMLVANWQPWRYPLEYKVPDERKGVFIFEKGTLDETSYTVYFYIMPSWSPALTAPPEKVTGHIVEMCELQKRQSILENKGNAPLSDEEKLRVYLEKAYIYDRLGYTRNRDLALDYCIDPSIQITDLRSFLVLIDWKVANKIPSQNQDDFWRALYFPKRADTFLKLYKPSDPLLEKYLLYADRYAGIYGQYALLLADNSVDLKRITQCVTKLLKRKDIILFPLLHLLIERDKISIPDLAQILSFNLMWLFDKLAVLGSRSKFGFLIVEILPKFASESISNQKKVVKWVREAVKKERDLTIKGKYYRFLVENGYEEGLSWALQALKKGMISDAIGMSIFSAAPQKALKILQQNPADSFHQIWINRLKVR